MAAKVVVTLVHGTWADTRGWVAPGSFLRRELDRRLDHLTFRAFAWSGRNTHAARTEAGASLAQFIRDGHARYPDAHHFVVAHSHGGNVALYAMRDPAARDLVAGIVTLGTPFIYTRCRDVARHAHVLSWLMLGVAALIPFVVLDALDLLPVAFTWLGFAAFLMVEAEPRLRRWLIEAAKCEQASIVAALQPPNVDASQLAILCAQGDEIRGWLRTWDVVARTPFIVGCVLVSLVGVVGPLNLPSLLDTLAQSTLHRPLDEIHILGLDGWALSVGVLVLCLVCGVLVMGSSVVRWAGYWGEPLLTNVLVEIGSERVPQTGSATSYTVNTFDIGLPPAERRKTEGYLRHTAICEYPAVAFEIGDWIATRCIGSSGPRVRSAAL